MKTFLGMPVRHHGEHVGSIYLTEKVGGREFTSEDQDVLVMFASQAGAAILNARRYRDGQQARADLEALVNISPVGVLVFDGKPGDLISVRETSSRAMKRRDGLSAGSLRRSAGRVATSCPSWQPYRTSPRWRR